MNRRTFLALSTVSTLGPLARLLVSPASAATVTAEARPTPLILRPDERVHEVVYPRPPVAAAIEHGPHDWLTAFQDIEGWAITAEGITDPVVRRCTYRPLFHDRHIEFAWSAAEGTFRLTPPKPLRLPDAWDMVDLWLGGVGTIVCCTLHCLDRDGQARSLVLEKTLRELDQIHRYVPLAQRQALQGASVEAFEVRVTSNASTRLRLYAMTFYEARRRQTYERPKALPFPTHTDGVVPTPTVTGVTRVTHTDDGTTFVFRTKDGAGVVYTVTPKTGMLDDVQISVDSGAAFRPCVGGGLIFDVQGKTFSPSSAPGSTRLVRRENSEDRLTTDWETRALDQAIRYQLAFRVVRRSLVIEAQVEGSAAMELRIGYPDTPGKHREIQFPMFTWFGGGPSGSQYPIDPMPSRGGNGQLVPSPGVLLAGDTFLTAILDWYASDASYPYAVTHTGGAAGFDGGAYYVPMVDRGRNPLREKLILTASPDVADVLPNIPNPPSRYIELMRDRVYQHGAVPAIALTRRRNLGITAVATLAQTDLAGYEGQLDKGVMDDWIDHPSEADPFNGNTDQPKRPGESGFDTHLRQIAAVRELGWLIGTYTLSIHSEVPYANFAQIPKILNHEGMPKDVPGYTWTPVTGEVIPYMQRQMRKIQDKCAMQLMYDDVRTIYPVWTFTDYNPALPNSGKFRETFEQAAQLYLARGTAVNGPVLSEGGNHWIYSGLIDGNFARTYGTWSLATGAVTPIPPDLVDFQLQKIHGLSVDIGGSNYFQQWGAATREKHLCETLAYGKIGFWNVWSGADETPAMSCRTYYTFHLAQQRYRSVPVAEIRYHNGTALVDASAIIKEGKERMGRIYTRFANGFESWTNLNEKEPWKIPVDGEDWELPPFGWYQRRKEEWGTFLNVSALRGGAHCWRVEDRETLLVGSAAGTPSRWADVEADGTVILREDAAGRRCVINVDATEFRLRAHRLTARGVQAPAEDVKLDVSRLDGAGAGQCVAPVKDGWVSLAALAADHFAVARGLLTR
jgi:hypothetical protein